MRGVLLEVRACATGAIDPHCNHGSHPAGEQTQPPWPADDESAETAGTILLTPRKPASRATWRRSGIRLVFWSRFVRAPRR